MKYVFFVLSSIFSIHLFASEVVIGLIPGGDPVRLKSQAQALAASLQEKLQEPVKIYISKDYQGLAQAFKEGKVQFAFFNPQIMIMAEKQTPLKVLLKKVWKEPFYYSTVLVRKDSKVKNLKQLSGKKIVFVDKGSTSGYLYPKNEMQSRGIKWSDELAVFSGNHRESIKMLEEGSVEAAAVFADDPKGVEGAWTQFAKNKSGFRSLWISEAIPNDPFCVRQDFYDKSPKVVHSLMYTLIELMESPQERNQFDEILGNAQLVPATSRHYDSVRAVMKTAVLESAK